MRCSDRLIWLMRKTNPQLAAKLRFHTQAGLGAPGSRAPKHLRICGVKRSIIVAIMTVLGVALLYRTHALWRLALAILLSELALSLILDPVVHIAHRVESYFICHSCFRCWSCAAARHDEATESEGAPGQRERRISGCLASILAMYQW